MDGKSNKPESKIPIPSPAPLRRAGSLRLGACPPIQEHISDVIRRPKLNRHRSLQLLNTATSFGCDQDDDADSVKSFSSTTSVCSNVSQCDHAHFARNGTTYSGRCKRYVVHCSPHSTETDDYLTPTQRTNRTIRKLRNLLKEAQGELIEKDKEIVRLTKEVVQLRLLKVDTSAEPNEGDLETRLDQTRVDSAQSDLSTRSYQLNSSPHLRYCSSPPLAQSLSDSGHFEDLNSSKEGPQAAHSQVSQIKTPESVQRQHEDELRELKERHNDRVDSLLQRISDVNDRYYALRPIYEDCKEKLHELEKANEELKNKSCLDHITKIAELEAVNEELLQYKQQLMVELNILKQDKEQLELNKSSNNHLEIEMNQWKSREHELMISLAELKEEKDSKERNIRSCFSDECCQTEDVNLQDLHNGNTVGSQDTKDSSEQNKQCRECKADKAENAELKKQIVSLVENIKQLENQALNDKDIYMQLYQKGIEAAKLMNNETIENGQTEDSEGSLIPNLLQKLRVQQDELDNLKGMYRRLLETRKEQPKHDPEMTLQFLKSAFYYFLTDRENAQGHLSAIESILGFTENEKINIEKAFLWR